MIANDFYLSYKTDKPAPKGSAVNVIYFTNKCNLACTYCYEDLINRPPQILNRQDIRDYVDAVFEREDPNEQTSFILFGGEPTLEWKNVCYLMAYAFKHKQNVHFNLTTNGIRYKSQGFINETKKNFFYSKGLLSIDISFDGVGNQERIFHNGTPSTKTMLEIFRKLNENRMRYRIRYTIQRYNINKAYEDISRIIGVFHPERLITSVAWDTLNDTDLIVLNQLKEQFRSDWRARKITTPICEMFCDMCNGCTQRKQLKTYFTDEGNVTTYENGECVPPFHDFKDKEHNEQKE